MICKFTILYRFSQKIFRPLPERMPYTGNFYPYPVARGTHGVSALPVSTYRINKPVCRIAGRR